MNQPHHGVRDDRRPTPPLPARADTRVALVVGVGAYVNMPALRNTTNDAVSVGAALERLGSSVDIVLDPNKGALNSAIHRFGERAMEADAALFFYAGHALVSGIKELDRPSHREYPQVARLAF